jgi:nitrite reductase (NO-forming)
MSFARRILVLALVVQALGFVREVVFAIGIERFVTTVTTLSDPALVAATGAFATALAVLVPVWRGNRWATLLTVPLMIILLAALLPATGSFFGSPSSANFLVWLTVTTILVAAVVGIPVAVVATLESFGRLPPTRALRAGGGFGATAVFVAGAIGSLVGMTTMAVAVAAGPAPSGGSVVDGAPDATATVGLRELRFEPQRLELEAGRTTAVFVTNEDPFDHSFDVDELDVHVRVAAGQTAVVVLTPEAAGSLALYCGIPGHTEAGMVADLIVR